MTHGQLGRWLLTVRVCSYSAPAVDASARRQLIKKWYWSGMNTRCTNLPLGCCLLVVPLSTLTTHSLAKSLTGRIADIGSAVCPLFTCMAYSH